MFYSETLLAKTGPLARVWLSANIEKKLTRHHVLESNIESSVSAIVDQGQAPLALRLSGQLLLGVVRIYSRKTRYLLDDCNEAILKIKMAFRPGNVDLPAQAHTANAASLVLPDVITELDLLAPMPDPGLLLGDDFDTPRAGPDPTLLDNGSQRLPSSTDRSGRYSAEPGLLPDLDLGLDIGDSHFEQTRERSVEFGRDAPAPRTIADEMADTTGLYEGPDLGLDLGDSELALGDSTLLPSFGNETAKPGQNGLHRGNSESPLSSARPSVDRDLERSFQPNRESSVLDEDASVHHAQRAKRRRLLLADTETEMRSSDLRALQQDRSKILKPATFLPRDPVLLALMQMQREGNFVSSLLGDGRRRGMAPELRGILSLEVVRKSAELKRKRDAGVPIVEEEPEVHLPQEDEALYQPGGAFDFADSTILPGQETIVEMDVDNELPSVQPDAFDETVAPPLHPADSGPVSLGTKRAVHLLRERFNPGGADAPTPSKRTKSSVLFQELLPERSTTRADATKMFFEVLVLATKDAVKVEQGEGLGGELRIRGKRGLWGSWAEESVPEEGEEDDEVIGGPGAVAVAA